MFVSVCINKIVFEIPDTDVQWFDYGKISFFAWSQIEDDGNELLNVW